MTLYPKWVNAINPYELVLRCVLSIRIKKIVLSDVTFGTMPVSFVFGLIYERWNTPSIFQISCIEPKNVVSL